MQNADGAQRGPAVGTDAAPPDLVRALHLFDETTRALEARSQRLEEVLTIKQRELQVANQNLHDKVEESDRLQRYLQLILDAVASGVVAVDDQGRVMARNPAARAVLGDLPPGTDYRGAAPESPVWATLASGEAVALQEREQSGGEEGGVRQLRARATPLLSGDGQHLGAVEVFDDVTGIRHLEQQLERAERLKSLGEMAAGVAHEIRNPLNGIEGFASLLARDLGDAPGRRFADAIIDGVRHLNRTVTGLLAFTRPAPPSKRPVPPVELIRSCLELLEAEGAGGDEAAESTVPVRFDNHWPDEFLLRCDPGQIRQVLLNLMQNACQVCRQASVTEPQVRVGLSTDADGTRFIVDDNGPGVPQAERHRIFTPFFTTRDSGTGLGLAVAHTIVSLHSGSLSVDDSPLGGARFVLALPPADRVALGSTASPATADGKG